MNTVPYQPRNLLITGGCGFIGANFIRWLLTEENSLGECCIVNLDKLTYAGNPENLRDLETDSRYRFVHGDICDAALVHRLLDEARIDTVLNFAAESHVDRSILDCAPFVQTNIVGTQVLLDACREAGIARYLQVSTDEVYGSLEQGGYFTETTPLAPNSPYAASKAAADLLVRGSVQTHGFPALVTRCSNNYGPFQFPEKLIPLFIANALNDEALPVYGDGRQVRDWIHVADHCRGILAALTQGRPGEIYNLGGRCELENLVLIRMLLAILEKPESLIRFVKDRPGHDRRYAIDCTKAERELGWSPRVSLEQGLRETVQWYRHHVSWVEHIRTGAYLAYYQQQYGARLENEPGSTT